MSLGDRLREMLDPGSSAGAGGTAGAARRRSRTQAEPVGGFGPDGDHGRPMPRAQWLGIGLVAAIAVALTAGLVFVILTVTRSGTVTPTPTPLPVVASPTTASSIAAIFASPVTTPQAPPSPTAQAVGQRLQVANTGGEGANMRREPGPTGERLKIIPDGGIVDVVGPDRSVDGSTWRNVRDLQGDVGWIAASFLAAEGTAPIVSAPGPATSGGSASTAAATPRPTTAPATTGSSGAAGRGQVGNTGGQGANMRSEPGSGGRILKTLGEGAAIEVLGPEREVDGVVWRQVRDSAGVTGWIIRSAVAPAGSVATPPPSVPRPTAAPAAATPASKPVIVGTPRPQATAPPAPPAGNPTAAPAAPTATRPPGDLPIIIQPATPRPR